MVHARDFRRTLSILLALTLLVPSVGCRSSAPAPRPPVNVPQTEAPPSDSPQATPPPPVVEPVVTPPKVPESPSVQLPEGALLFLADSRLYRLVPGSEPTPLTDGKQRDEAFTLSPWGIWATVKRSEGPKRHWLFEVGGNRRRQLGFKNVISTSWWNTTSQEPIHQSLAVMERSEADKCQLIFLSMLSGEISDVAEGWDCDDVLYSPGGTKLLGTKDSNLATAPSWEPKEISVLPVAIEAGNSYGWLTEDRAYVNKRWLLTIVSLTDKQVKTVRADNDGSQFSGTSFDPTGRFMVADYGLMGQTFAVSLYDLTIPAKVRNLPIPTDQILGAWSADGEFLATRTLRTDEVSIWNTATWTRVATDALTGLRGPAAWLPDPHLVLLKDDRGTAVIVDLDTGARRVMEGTRNISMAAWSR